LTASCPICARGHPLDVLADLPASWITAPPAAPLPGYACVVARLHVIEPFELDPPDRLAFWEDCMLAGRALNSLFSPRKMNYEIHGNTIPHLHMHLYPRYAGDPYGTGPIDGRATFHRSSADLAHMKRALVGAGAR